MLNKDVERALDNAGWFQHAGSSVLVDGQFGSTGKGLMADVLAQYALSSGYMPTMVTTNAGPNSGHTAEMDDGRRIMTQQLPVLSVVARHIGGVSIPTYLNGGAVLDMAQVHKEMQEFGVMPFLHESAAIIHPDLTESFNTGSMDSIASTGKGVGQAMAAKVLRMPYTVGSIDLERAARDTKALAASRSGYFTDVCTYRGVLDYSDERVFVETAQGFSLGINSGFYPYTTSRECSVPQALADAGLPHNTVSNVVMCVRTYPIRVGNTSLGNSGPCYEDQRELTWDEVGQTPELTSVTKRVRRVFSWSNLQFADALRVNAPDTILLNFFQYLPVNERDAFIHNVIDVYEATLGYPLKTLLLGHGPRASDVTVA